MAKNLVIVESPAKAKTIEGYLGKDFLVKSSFGHIRDLKKGNKGVLVEQQFQPVYEVSTDKKTVVSELKKLADAADLVWLASDEDREGEAISWHLKEVLKLKDEKIKRIVFHEITKPAILRAIENPRGIDYNLVNAQQARRVLDRLVGFEISPVLWKKVKPSLSAGRVQSVAVRLVVEREREISGHESVAAFKVSALMFKADGNGKGFKAEWPQRFETETAAQEFLEMLKGKDYMVTGIEQRPVKKSPAPPFTTSTLQQEASRKLRFSVTRTMRLAQELYESGKITYMRTDSVNLSDTALEASENEIKRAYGQQYHQLRKYKTKTASAQEAHEAIRPTYFEQHTIEGDRDVKALYDLIWKRAIASQMADAQIEKTILKIQPAGMDKAFQAEGEVIRFDGFLKVYLESDDEEEDQDAEQGSQLPLVKEGEAIHAQEITATQRFSRPASRYTEASLVKKLEELGIGRPSTYAPTISTIQKRGYVERSNLEGVERDYVILSLHADKLVRTVKTEKTGADKGKMVPTDIGMLVSDFLLEHFPKVMDYQFTANVEEEFDHIAEGMKNWQQMIEGFYKPFHANVEDTIENSERITGERMLGKDPLSGFDISVRMGRFGPIAVKTDPNEPEAKPVYANLRQGMHLEQLSLEDALELFKLPRELGDFEEKPMLVAVGKFGPYVKHDGKFVSLKKEQDPMSITAEEAIELIRDKRTKDANRLIHDFKEAGIQVLNGMYGPYISRDKKNYKIPKGTDAQALSLDECLQIIEATPVTKAAKKPPRTKKRG
ncbi:MAG: type I DNA topoisomerase [Bacteroidia bacterium]